MSSKEEEILEAVHKEISPDYTKSVVGQATRHFHGDKDKVIDFFQPHVPQTPVVSIPVYEVHIKSKPGDTKTADAEHIYAEFIEVKTPAKSVNTKTVDTKTVDIKSVDTKSIDTKSVDTKTADTKTVDTKSDQPSGVSAEELAKRKEEELFEMLEEQDKRSILNEHTYMDFSQDEVVEQKIDESTTMKPTESVKAESSKVDPVEPAKVEPVEPAQPVKDEPVKCESKEVESQQISSRHVVIKRCSYGDDEDDDSSSEDDDNDLLIKVPPEYMKGRLPTDVCRIKVTVKDNVISFDWKIADNVELSKKDWIGLYIHDRQYYNKHETYMYLDGKKEGSGSFTARTVGYFDLRYYQNGGNEEKSRSEAFLVGPKMEVKARLEGRRKICVKWNRTIEKPGDWIGLYAVSTYSNKKYIGFNYTSYANSEGEITFDAPRTPGEYEVRYFFSDAGYTYSGRSQHIVIPNEDEMEVISTHPIVKIHWQTFSQEPNSSDWIGIYASAEDSAKLLYYEYLKNGAMDSVGDHGIVEIDLKQAELPEGSDKWEVRLCNKAPVQPFLRVPFIKPVPKTEEKH